MFHQILKKKIRNCREGDSLMFPFGFYKRFLFYYKEPFMSTIDGNDGDHDKKTEEILFYKFVLFNLNMFFASFIFTREDSIVGVKANPFEVFANMHQTLMLYCILKRVFNLRTSFQSSIDRSSYA
jgi:hypothetical protein